MLNVHAEKFWTLPTSQLCLLSTPIKEHSLFQEEKTIEDRNEIYFSFEEFGLAVEGWENGDFGLIHTWVPNYQE